MPDSTDGFSTCVVIGAGISGLATAKQFLSRGIQTTIVEKSDHVAGLWQFTEDSYGVMSFTHINVSKHNYSFSDFPFPDDVQDYPHWSQMAQYVNDYVDHFKIRPHIRFRQTVQRVTKAAPGSDGANWALHIEEASGHKYILRCRYLAVASGHHAEPKRVTFPGQDTFPGEIVHSVSFKDAQRNKLEGKRVVVVGIGNSAVDVAVNCVDRAKGPVTISTRSGTWVLPNYIFGSPTDHYACRLFFMLPVSVQKLVFELIVTLLDGHPSKWGYNPKMRALSSQPTVSGTLTFHVQRGNVKVRPNIASFDGSTVHFEDGSSTTCDAVIMCTC